jgi:hypothetical protein
MLVRKLAQLAQQTPNEIFAYRFTKVKEAAKTYRQRQTLEFYNVWTRLITPENVLEIVTSIEECIDVDDFPVHLSYLLERCEIPYDIIPASCIVLQMIATSETFEDVVRVLASKKYIPKYLLLLVQREAYHMINE